jgi:hypothetical protein
MIHGVVLAPIDMPTIVADGILFIGDPHQTSKAPGRRLDEMFYETVACKIEQSLLIAKERNLIPVFLGDFFDRDDDTDGAMLVRTVKALRVGGHTPWTLVGNHDKRRTVLTEDTALSVLIAAGLLMRMPDNGPGFLLETVGYEGGKFVVGVGSTGYDHEVPKDVRSVFVGYKVDDVIWTTHHDWMFENGYPNAMQPHEIKGCSMVVNGHNHLTKTPVKRGETMFFNPGNITRMSVDAHNHTPRVWTYKSGQPKLFPIPLDYKKDVFDWTGKVAHATVNTEPVMAEKSAFVALLSNEIAGMETTTQDGTKFLERMTEFFTKEEVPTAVQNRLRVLFESVRYEKKE